VKIEEEKKSDHIEEYFSKNEIGQGNELFRIDDKNSDIKSELSEEEIRYINTLIMNDQYLERAGIGAVFKNYYRNFLRLKVSLKRQGRQEYVAINKRDNSDETIAKFGNLQNVFGAKRP